MVQRSLGARLVREPLLQFLVIGAALFALQASVGAGDAREGDAGDAQRIVMSAATLEGLAQEQLVRTGRRPSDTELRGLAERYVDEEVLYREALRLSLDKGDPIVRRRLVQKMQFISQDLAHIAEPSDAELEAWIGAHQGKFTTPGRVTIEHLFFSRDRRGEAAKDEAAVLLLALQDGTARVEGQGDPFVHGKRMAARSEVDLTGQFGAGFARAAMEAPVDRWAGPVESSYGWHLVRVTERFDERPASLDEVRGRVRREIVEERRAAANRDTIEKLRGQWDVAIDPLPKGGTP